MSVAVDDAGASAVTAGQSATGAAVVAADERGRAQQEQERYQEQPPEMGEQQRGTAVVPRGRNVSRRPWKPPCTRRASASVQKSKGQRKTWERKVREREERKSLQALEAQLRATAREQRVAEHKRIAERRKQREENERRTGTTYQVVTDPNKIKRMSKRQWKMLRKMDVTAK